jgi:succinoglycan biosynthesis transport protein ExoP
MNTTNTPASSDDMALDLGRLLSAIGSSLKWLLPLVFIVAGCVFVALSFMPSKFRGEAKVLIESTDAKFPGAARGVEGERALLDAEGVASQVQLLMSADLARRVAKKLDLASEPEFEATRGGSLISDALAMLGLSSRESRSSVEEKVLKHYYKNIEVFRLEGSRVIAVRYSAQNPELAASVANMVVDEYISLQTRAKRDTTEVAATAMEPQIEQLRKEVQASRKAVEDFRARADLLIGTDNLTLNQRQLADISSQYSAAQAKSAESQAKADLVRELLNSGGSLETASDVLSSQLIQRLRERQVALQSNIAELSITLLPNHPQLKALNSQLADYNRQIRGEARKVLVGLENDAKLARQQAAALEGRLNELKSAAARSNADQVRLNELEREANAKASQLDTLLTSFRDADMRLRAQALPADARIISRASVPIEPYAPKVMAITIISALVTFVLGCAFVILREFLSGNVLYPTTRAMPLQRNEAIPVGANWNTTIYRR